MKTSKRLLFRTFIQRCISTNKLTGCVFTIVDSNKGIYLDDRWREIKNEIFAFLTLYEIEYRVVQDKNGKEYDFIKVRYK